MQAKRSCSNRRWVAGRIATVMVASLAGCAGPGPRLFPVAPVAGNSNERRYDTDGDGHADYAEVFAADGMIRALRYDTTGDGSFDDHVVLDQIPADERRHLIMILDSVPFSMVADLWRQGRFRLFHPPSRVISPFPVMTDPCLTEFFGLAPCPGVESAYFDGQTLRNGYEVYASSGNVPWQQCVDYHMDPVAHVFAYTWPRGWYGHELRRIQDRFQQADQPTFIGYVVGTSAMGARIGRDGHQSALIQLDRFCQQVMFDSHGRVHITMLSDHGHNLVRSRRIPLSDLMREFGYQVGTSLDACGDVVVPEFGIVTCAGIHTRTPEPVARDVLGIEGVELAAYRDDDDRVVVLSRDGTARIERAEAGLRYEPDDGDPLQLAPILAELAGSGQMNADGFVSDGVLLEATVDHVYPDAVYRLWRAFHGLITHCPDVLVSIADGYHCGSATMSDMIGLKAAHGSLRRLGSTAFAMTTAGQLPPVIRMETLRTTLQETGVPLPQPKTQNRPDGPSTVEPVRPPAPIASGGVVE